MSREKNQDIHQYWLLKNVHVAKSSSSNLITQVVGHTPDAYVDMTEAISFTAFCYLANGCFTWLDL